ncbi:MAG TPA: hypothetical protein VHY18_03605 [Solirubrobacteraceae bacterium]|nr:hypothetical protein [Solirubrobacteraceae bacterium]
MIVGLLAIVAVLVFWQQLFDHWTFPWDFVGAYTTTPPFVSASIGGGHFPVWSPYVASGFPVDVDPQAGLYFPGWWLLGGLGIPATLRVLTAVQVAHVLFGSVGVLALARVRRLGWSWAAVAAVAYLLFGGFYGEAEHSDIIRGFAYLPWLLWALTPPRGDGRWVRLAAVPLLAWLIASGAYPGQIISFGLTGFVYVGVTMWSAGWELWRRYWLALVLAALSAGAVVMAVLLPYLRAEQAHELYRVFEPTATVRAGESIAPRDLLGLYLNNFAWTYDGTVTSWAVGIPVLIGLFCVRIGTLRRQTPLAVCGAVALVLAMAPKIGVIGRAMVSIRPLFSSRFPAAEYKAVVAIAMVIVAADAWSQIATQRRRMFWRATLAVALVIIGALLAPSTYGPVTREMWLVIAVALAACGLVLVRMPPRLVAGLLIGLVIVDGVREAYDYRLLGRISPWRTTPAEAVPYRARDVAVRKLPMLLEQAPTTRPARVPPYAPLSTAPTGSDPDATGWIANGYHVIDYGGTIERVLWRAEHNPAWLSLLLAPWHGYTFPCTVVGCESGAVHLPYSGTWHPGPGIQTTSYGEEHIVYSVNVSRPELLVENELAIRGWSTNSPHVASVDAGIPLRAWRLSPGRYTFVASFHEPDRWLQWVALALSLATLLACARLIYGRSVFNLRLRRDEGIET